MRSITVGKTAGNGALNINPGGSISFKDPCTSVIIGGVTTTYASYYRHSGDLDTVGDFVMGFSGGMAIGHYTGTGTLAIGGTLRLGSFMSPGPSSFEFVGSSGATITAGGLEVGSVGELIYNFNSGNSLKTIVVAGNVSLQSGSTGL